MTKFILILTTKNEENYADYFNKMVWEMENGLKEFDKEYIVVTEGNTDKTEEILRKNPKIKIIGDGIDEDLKTLPYFERLGFIRQKTLEYVRKKSFDFLILLDSDIFFNIFMIKKMISEMMENDLDVLTPNTLCFPYPVHYDSFAYRSVGSKKTFKKKDVTHELPSYFDNSKRVGYNREVDSSFGGLALYKRDVIMNKNVSYLKYYKKGEKVCEHVNLNKTIKEQGYKLYFSDNICPIWNNNWGLSERSEYTIEYFKNLFSTTSYKNFLIFLDILILISLLIIFRKYYILILISLLIIVGKFYIFL